MAKTRDDFSQAVKERLAKRAGYLCSNPDCRAPTTGPQRRANARSVNVGKAAHITAAAQGGPRYDPSITTRQRSAQKNGIWLCGICADKVDKDEKAHPVELLQRWKTTAEEEARRQLGRPKAAKGDPYAAQAREVRRWLRLRDKMEHRLLRPFDIDRDQDARPYERFSTRKLVVRALGDTTYPEADEPRDGEISPWFRVEPYDFYTGGLRVVLRLLRGIIDEDERWAIIEYNETFDPAKYQEVKICLVGKIPWRNIREFDPKGDGYYPVPHIHCAFADGGEPYEGFDHVLHGPTYDWPLDPDKELKRSTDAAGHHDEPKKPPLGRHRRRAQAKK